MNLREESVLARIEAKAIDSRRCSSPFIIYPRLDANAGRPVIRAENPMRQTTQPARRPSARPFLADEDVEPTIPVLGVASTVMSTQ